MSSLKISFGQQAELHPIFTFTFIGLKPLEYMSLYYTVMHYLTAYIILPKNLTTMILIISRGE